MGTKDSLMSITDLARSVAGDFRRAWRALVRFEVLFKVFCTLLLVPATAWLLAALVARTGRAAVSNTDLVGFLLSPAGLLYAAVVGVGALALAQCEQAGLMSVAALNQSDRRLTTRRALAVLAVSFFRVLRLGAVRLVALVLVFAPFAAIAGLAYLAFLTRHDVNYYLAERPPEFYAAAGVGGLLLLGALAVGVWLYVRWAFALPVLLFEGRFATAALRESAARVRGAGWRVGATLFGWQAIGLGAACAAGFHALASALLDVTGPRPSALVPVLALLLAGQALLAAVVSFLVVTVHSLLVLRLYADRSARLGKVGPEGWRESLAADSVAAPVPAWMWAAGAAALVGVAVTAGAGAARVLGAPGRVQVTGHRGHGAAPENTLAAIRKAVEDGADYAEIDVQETSDGVLVLLNDEDLAKVAHFPRKIAELSFDEARKLDLGARFGPEFAGERIATLAEAIALARGKIKLNIELKYYGKDRGLAEKVVRTVRDEDFEAQSVITSLAYDGLLEVKRHNPRLRTGYIVATAVGDVTRLDVDFLSVGQNLVDDKLLSGARRANKEVHVWTVDEPEQMAVMIEKGVDNIITNDPGALVRLLRERAGLGDGERMVLASRALLGLRP